MTVRDEIKRLKEKFATTIILSLAGTSHHSENPSRGDRRVGIVAVTAISAIIAAVGATTRAGTDDIAVAQACAEAIADGLPLIAENRAERFQGKVDAARARCRGGEAPIS